MPYLTVVVLAIVGGAFLWLLQSYLRQRRANAQLTAQVAKQTQDLQEVEQRRAEVFSANPYPMWVYDCETLRFLEVNDAALKAYGYSREEFLAMTLVDIRPPDDSAAFLDAAKERHNGYSHAGVWRHRRKDGSILLVEIKAFEFQRDGRPVELILAIDVTERHRMEEALRESQASLQSLVDNAPFGIALSLVDEDRMKT